METIYLICLIFGGFFLAVSIFAGAEAETDFSFNVEGDAADAPAGEGLISAAQYFSFRNIVFFTAFFGLAGVILSKLSTPALPTFLAAITLGGCAGAFSHKLMSYLKSSESGESLDTESLAGLTAKALVDIAENRKGKIRVQMQDRTFQLIAQLADVAKEKQIKHGQPVIILRVENGIAHVAEESFIDS